MWHGEFIGFARLDLMDAGMPFTVRIPKLSRQNRRSFHTRGSPE
ncbi:hypothetical protein Msi02_56150 [Microbispora siamensis]|uniref:Uncharacterized protein n=1 Tax=Microbispora siamensis TaxID=564413 RepID=A0ABQ4GTM9_9ACTN|nr:hypothetical protein Msi02_56150 [Microbispora siamensis]